MALHNEQKEILELLQKAQTYDQIARVSQIARQEEILKAAVEAARQKGLQEGRKEAIDEAQKNLFILRGFLCLVSYRRLWSASPSFETTVQEDAAFEHALHQIYSLDLGREACEKLFYGNEEPVNSKNSACPSC